MTWADWYRLGLWAVIVGGLVPAGYFLATYRPRRRFAPAQLDAAGWVQVVVLLYLLGAYNAATGQREVPARPEGAFSLLVGAAIDGLLLLRAVVWWRVRRSWGPARHHVEGVASDT